MLVQAFSVFVWDFGRMESAMGFLNIESVFDTKHDVWKQRLLAGLFQP